MVDFQGVYMRPEKWEKWGEMSEKVGICATESQKKTRFLKLFYYIFLFLFLYFISFYFFL